MIRLHQLRQDETFLATPELPARLLKRVLVGHKIHVGGRVLIAGCGHGELVAFLDSVSFDVDGIDDSSAEVETAQRLFPHLSFSYRRLDELVPASLDEFDLILVQDLCVYRGNLLDLKTRSATANLLACLKPAGDLVYVRKQSGQLACGTTHSATCWKRHLACFPGQLETRDYPETLWESARWDWLVGQRPHSSYLTVTLQTPAEKLDRSVWQDFASRGLMTGKGSCCAVAEQALESSRRAA